MVSKYINSSLPRVYVRIKQYNTQILTSEKYSLDFRKTKNKYEAIVMIRRTATTMETNPGLTLFGGTQRVIFTTELL